MRDLTLRQALIRRFFGFRRVDKRRLLPRLAGISLLGHRQELVLRDVNVLDVDESVLGFVRVTQDANDGLSNGLQRGGAKEALAAIEERGLALLPVQQEVLREAPVQEGAVTDQRVGEVGVGGGSLAEYFVRVNLGFEDGQGGGLGVGKITAEVGWKEALHVCGYGGFDEDVLRRQACHSDGRDYGVLALEGGSDGVYG